MSATWTICDLSANFDLEEFACKCGKCELSLTAVASYRAGAPVPDHVKPIIENLRQLCKNVLEFVRKKFGVPVTILSGYRCPRWNKYVGGATKSKHMEGHAADCYLSKVDLREVYEYGITVPHVGGAEYYELQRFVHFDTRPKRALTDPPAHWEGR